jgi:chromosomal replication initiator protein
MTAAVAAGVWNDILGAVEKRMNPQSFATWFRPLQFHGCDAQAGKLILRAPNQVIREWVTTTYSQVLHDALAELGLAHCRLEWNIDEGVEPELAPLADRTAAPAKLERDETEPMQTASLFTLLEAAEPARLQQSTAKPSLAEQNDPSWNPKYSFQTFVVGSCNQFAHAATLAVAESPGTTYNPLYIYGGVGLGKTHLMHAAGHAIAERNRHLRITYISAEKFMNELINAIRYDKTQSFREKYRSIDVLMIDDIQFMAGKERTQEEFFHTFNALYDRQKQIVISSDCPPREIPTLEERLHSRFEWGLIADIEPPDLETKVAILKRKADLDGVALPDDVAFYIASKVKSNIRELEGSLVRLVAISSLRGLPISKMLAQDAIRNIAEDDRPGGISIEQIQQAVSAHYRMRVDELKSKNNARQIAVPRQIAMYLCKRLTGHSYPEIGREFGGKHHTTVIHSVEKIEALVLRDSNTHRVISDLMDGLCK